MCLVLTNPVDILAVRHVKRGIEAGGFRTGHPSNYFLLLSNPNMCGPMAKNSDSEWAFFHLSNLPFFAMFFCFKKFASSL